MRTIVELFIIVFLYIVGTIVITAIELLGWIKGGLVKIKNYFKLELKFPFIK